MYTYIFIRVCIKSIDTWYDRVNALGYICYAASLLIGLNTARCSEMLQGIATFCYLQSRSHDFEYTDR